MKKFIEVVKNVTEENIPKQKRTNKTRSWVTQEVQKWTKNKVWKNVQKLNKENKVGLGHENTTRLEKLRIT